MAENAGPNDGIFPILDEAEIARLMPLGTESRFAAGQVVFDQVTPSTASSSSWKALSSLPAS